jgi:subtilase family serine protease
MCLFAYLLVALALPLLSAQSLQAQAITNPLDVRSTDRINGPIDDRQRVVLQGQVHNLARSDLDRGAVPSDFAMKRMILAMRGDATQEAALDALVEAQRNPASSLYHKWLTPQEFGERFGVSQNDVVKIEGWLQGHGFQVEEVNAAHHTIVFSGTAAQVQSTFQTSIHLYKVNGKVHHANASAPEIPAALSGVVAGVVSLNDFFSAPQHAVGVTPNLASGNAHYLTPGDLATIYDVAPLYGQGLDGSGQSIAVVGRADINLSDIRTFRSSFGLPVNDPAIIHPGASPGMANSADATEAALDVEWAGALAKKATVKFVPAASTSTTDGVYLSAEYIVNNNLAPVVSVSYSVCESTLGTAANKFMSNLWQQAAAQGMSVFVSAGDSGASGCDVPAATKATGVRAVNGLCSTPYSVCVGGTQFTDTMNPGLYWSSGDASGTPSAALNYIPEKAWNESGSGGLYSTGGGVSTIYAKPAWQAGLGVPQDGMRDVPDLALTAASHDGYQAYFNGSLISVGGTSLASPSLASIMALLVQHTEPQGNPNPRFYSLANSQREGGAAVFHDTTSGNNSVPGLTGFSAGVGYDQTTGLGSVDATLLVNHWDDPTAANDGLDLALGLSPTSQSITAVAAGTKGANITVTSTVTGSDTVALSATGLPAGVTAAFVPPSLAAPGSGTSTLNLTVASTAVNGVYTIQVTGTPGTITNAVATTPLTLTILGGQFITISAQPGAATSGVVSAAEGGTAAFSVTATGLPAVLTYQWHSQAPGGSDTPITGATKASYTTPTSPALTLSQDQTAFWVVITNTATSVTSSSAVLSVTPKAPVVNTPPANQTVILNGTSPNNATFEVADSGEPGTTYQWQQCGPTSSTTLCAATGTGWANVASGGTAASYNTGAIASGSASNGTLYRVVLSDTLCNPKIQGATAVVSTAATLNVQYVSGSGLVAKAVTEGTAATFGPVTPAGNPSTFTYQWYVQAPTQGAPIQLILGANAASYTTPATTITMSGMLYSVVISNAAVSWSSPQVALTVNPSVPVITSQPNSYTVIANNSTMASFSVGTDGHHPGLTYLWKVKVGSAAFAAAPGSNAGASYTTPIVTSAYNGNQYEVTVTDAAGSVTSSPATLTVDYVNVTTQPNSPSSADGKPASFTVVGAGVPTVLTYQWYTGTPGSGTLIVGATSASLALPSVNNSMNGNKYYCVISNSATSATSNAGVLTVTPPGPSIANQPQNQVAVVGQSATFLVVHAAEPSAPTITYQWQISTNAGLGWTNVTGATSASYITPAVAIVNNGTLYRVGLTDSTGGPIYSTAASLSVEYVTLNTQPSALTVLEGTSATFVVGAVGYPGLQYQWYSKTPAGSPTPITGAIHSSYTVASTSLTVGLDGTQYYVCVYNSAIACSPATQSTPVTLNVTAIAPAAPVVTSQPSNQTVAANAAAFTVSATGSPAPTIQWQYSSNGVSWTNVPNSLGTVINTGTTSVTSVLTVSGYTGSNDQNQFQAVLTNTKGTVTSSPVTLSVKHVTVPPASQTVITGQALTFNVSSTAGATAYQWLKSTNGGQTFVNVAEGSGGTTASFTSGIINYHYNGVLFEVAITYGSLGTITSAPANVSVDYISSAPLSQTVIIGNQANFTVTSSGTPTAYQWMVKTTSSGSYVDVGEASGLTANYTTSALASSYDQALYEVVITYGSLGTITSTPVTLNVNHISVQPVSKTVDTGSTTLLTVTATGAPSGYQWLKSTNGGAFVNVAEGSGGTSSSFTTGIFNYNYNAAQFEVQVSYGSLGTITSSPATITVNSITTQPSNQIANAGSEATFTVVATGSPTYQWSSSTDGGNNWSPITGATTKSYTTNKLLSADNGTKFEVALTYGVLGTVTSNAATLSVNFISTQPTPTSGNQGASATFTVAANNVPTGLPFGYQWRISINGGQDWSDITGANSATYIRTPLVQADDRALLMAVLTYPQGQVTSQAVALSVNYISTQPASTSKIPGNTATFSVQNSGSPSYQWQVSTNGGGSFANVSTSDGSTGQTSYMYTTGTLTSGNDQYQYRVLVNYGGTPITSSAATLTVKFLTIGTAPQNATIVSGTTYQFTVSATGTYNVPLTYQWYLNGGAVGTNSASYTTPVTNNGDNNDTVYVIVSDGGLVTAVTSATATLTVQPVPIISGQSATAITANIGDTPTLSVTALNGTGTQWYSCAANGPSCAVPPTSSVPGNWTLIGGATNSTYTLPAVTSANDQTQYEAITSNGVGGINSAPVTLTVNYVTIDAFEGYSEVADGGTAKFKVVAHGTYNTTLAYEWHVVASGGTQGAGGDTIIPGATTATYQIPSADPSLDGEMIYVIVSNGLGGVSGTSTSEPVTLMVEPAQYGPDEVQGFNPPNE